MCPWPPINLCSPCECLAHAHALSVYIPSCVAHTRSPLTTCPHPCFSCCPQPRTCVTFSGGKKNHALFSPPPVPPPPDLSLLLSMSSPVSDLHPFLALPRPNPPPLSPPHAYTRRRYAKTAFILNYDEGGQVCGGDWWRVCSCCPLCLSPPLHISRIVYGSTKGFVSYGGFTHVGFPLRTSVSPPTLYPSSLQLPLSPLSPSPVTTFPSSSSCTCLGIVSGGGGMASRHVRMVSVVCGSVGAVSKPGGMVCVGW